jgi:predicted nucleotidyltransferase
MDELASPTDLSPVLCSLSEWLNKENISYALIGGVAVSFAAQPRMTQDIDAIICLDPGLAAGFLESGKRYGFVPRISNPIEFARKSRVLLIRHHQTKVGIDLSCGVLPFEREVLDRATEVNAGSCKLKIATPEDLIIMKAVAHRQRDLIDIDNLLTVNPDVDTSRIRHWVAQFAEVLESPELVKDLDRIIDSR